MELTQPVAAKEDSVVEPFWPTVRRDDPVEEEIMNGFVPPVPWMFKVACGVEVFIPTFPEAITCRKEAPEEEATSNNCKVGALDVPCTTKVELGLEDPMPTLKLLVTLNTETPEEEETSKISLVPAVPCRLKVMVEDVALIPATPVAEMVSKIIPELTVLPEVHRAS